MHNAPTIKVTDEELQRKFNRNEGGYPADQTASPSHIFRITLYWNQVRFQDHLVLDNSASTIFAIKGYHKGMKPATEYHEGPEAWKRFKSVMGAVLKVPHSEIKKQIEEHRKQSALNPNRRGPKLKRTPASPGPAA